MKIFLDTASIDDIKIAQDFCVVDGVTTNPTIISESGLNVFNVIADICKIVSGPVSAEVMSIDYEGMIKEGDELAKIAPNVCIKLPMTPNGIRATKYFASKSIQTNLTLCFSTSQALLAARAGATFVSPFVGRIDDIADQGIDLIKDIRTIYDNYMYIETQIIAASIRSPLHAMQCAKIGADIATLPPKILKQMYKHPFTDIGIAKFLEDYKKSQIKK